MIGAGCVGLTHALCFAIHGHNVILCERDETKLQLLRKGKPHLYEPQLKTLLRKTLASSKLRLLSSIEEAIPLPRMIQIAVGTPLNSSGGLDLSQIQEASQQIGRALGTSEGYRLVVLRSTAIPGATESVVKTAIEMNSRKRCGFDFGLAMQPEFLREGSAVHDVLHPDRLVIGEHDKKAGDILLRFYRNFYAKRFPPLVRTNPPSAEFIKLVNNAFLATKISLINEVANICERVSGADVTLIAKAVGMDKRIGSRFLGAGLGFGGSCLPKDVRALIGFSQAVGYNPSILQAALDTNRRQAQHVLDFLRDRLGNLRGKRIALLGLSFKSNTDDMREAPSTRIVEKLLNEGAEVVAHDPVAIKKARAVFGDRIRFAASAIECLRDVDGCVVVTEWRQYEDLSPEVFATKMRRPLIIDGRRIYVPKRFLGKVEYQAIGRGSPLG